MHQRTLNRRLKDSGTSFRELYAKARHQTARRLLCDTGSSTENIASLLGYSKRNSIQSRLRTLGGNSSGEVAKADATKLHCPPATPALTPVSRFRPG